MNVLMYVMVMLMLLASLTYVKLEGFRSFASVEASFSNYMKNTERVAINEIAKESYDTTRVSGKEQKNNEKNSSSSRVSLNLLLNKEEREKNGPAFQQTREVLKDLMTNIFEKQTFFIEMNEKRPSFLNEILDEIGRAAEAMGDRKPTKADSLTALEFSDKDLHDVFYLMLNGVPRKSVDKLEEISDDSREVKEVPLKKDEEKAEEDALVEESNEAHGNPGQESLLDYITLKKSVKIRVFLAERPVLVAIFGNDTIANSIIEKRQELFKQVRRGDINEQEASKTFEATFQGSGAASNYGAILDFAVTKVNPKTYHKH